MSRYTKYIGFSGFVTLSGIIFQLGRSSESIDVLIGRVECMEGENEKIHNVIYDIHGKVSKNEEKMNSLEKEILFIRKKLFSK